MKTDQFFNFFFEKFYIFKSQSEIVCGPNQISGTNLFLVRIVVEPEKAISRKIFLEWHLCPPELLEKEILYVKEYVLGLSIREIFQELWTFIYQYILVISRDPGNFGTMYVRNVSFTDNFVEIWKNRKLPRNDQKFRFSTCTVLMPIFPTKHKNFTWKSEKHLLNGSSIGKFLGHSWHSEASEFFSTWHGTTENPFALHAEKAKRTSGFQRASEAQGIHPLIVNPMPYANSTNSHLITFNCLLCLSLCGTNLQQEGQ